MIGFAAIGLMIRRAGIWRAIFSHGYLRANCRLNDPAPLSFCQYATLTPVIYLHIAAEPENGSRL
jgi:hypothetical protein